MNRRTRRTIGVVGLAAGVGLGGLALLGAAGASAQSLTVNGSGSGAAASAQSLATQAKGAAAGAAAGTGATMYLNPGAPASSIAGFAGLASADQSYAQAMALTYAAYAALGGRSDRQAVIQRKDGMYYIGLDGEGGRWFAAADQAMAFMFNSLVAKDGNLKTETKQAVAYSCASDLLCAVLAVAKDPYVTIATVARGGTVDVTITGKGFSNTGGAPTVAASDGILVKSVTFVSSQTLSARFQVTQAAALGENFVAVFNTGTAFHNVGAYKLNVIDGKDSGPNTEWASKAVAAPLALPGSASGAIVRRGDEQFFKLDVTAAGTLTLSSNGGADVKATLEDAAGKVLATDDDAGTGYGFKLSGTIAPGTYYLRVGHCCGGIGTYQLDAAFAVQSASK
ncbi:MAG: PPC domain-containing protein [Alphaproteobacteria bacterium]|nr:PPC domain-containing protein [Alphaproteobacteria bacterium]